MNYLFNIYVFDIFPFRYFSLSIFFPFDIFPFRYFSLSTFFLSTFFFSTFFPSFFSTFFPSFFSTFFPSFFSTFFLFDIFPFDISTATLNKHVAHREQSVQNILYSDFHCRLWLWLILALFHLDLSSLIKMFCFQI